MTSKDLMIGDYIRLANDECVPENMRGKVVMVAGLRDDDGAIRVYTEIDNEHSLATYWSDDEDDFEPIPITPAILEKNGFKKEKGQWTYEVKRKPGICGQMCSNTNPTELVVWVTFDPLYFGVTNYNPDAHVDMEGKYVHQFQHALRLCGINKEIQI